MSDSEVMLFIATSLVVILIPGQDLVLVLSRGVTRGARSGLVTAAGVSTGLLGHTLMATAGLGALLLTSDFLFLLLKYAGAVYLCGERAVGDDQRDDRAPERIDRDVETHRLEDHR